MISFVWIMVIYRCGCWGFCGSQGLNGYLKREELLNASRARQHCKLRVVLAYCLLRYTAMNLSDVATLYMRTHGTLSRQISRFKENSDVFVSRLQMSKIEKALYQMVMK